MREFHDEFFDNSRTIEVYNSYDPYILSQTVKYYLNNGIESIKCCDLELDCLQFFKDVKYISLCQGCVNFEEFNKLTQLNGISLSASSLKYIDKKILERISYLQIWYDKKLNIKFEEFKSLKHLKIHYYPYEDLKIDNELISLEIHYSAKITELQHINTNKLKKLKLDYLKNLQRVEVYSSSIISFCIKDCKKIIGLEKVLSKLPNLEDLTLISESSDRYLLLQSVAFINNLCKLEKFSTNYRIYDGDLRPLLKLTDVNITEFYRNYNVKDKYLPHKYVLIEENGCLSRVELGSLPRQNEDARIVWMD
ncbi:MAG: hypothetical protein J6C23_03465 [Clostridia bacterium]|nr:hypothetical protein [Clostridia bacterium]